VAEDRAAEVPRFDKAARRAERARMYRLSRLPFLYDFALRGSRQALVAGTVQIVLVLAAVLVPAKLITGDWLPAGVGIAVLAVAFAVQGLNRYLNAKAGRR
jgi:hypothetical protein